jgi:NhaA family Na+:H+ antiporter
MSARRMNKPVSLLREFLESGASGGIILMIVAALALIVANSPLADGYFNALEIYIGPLSVHHWINDGLMALFFLLVGLEIKREMTDGQLSTWSRRILPGVAALGGMLVPALIYLYFNMGSPDTVRGWAIPSATDIAFALGVLSLLGNRVPTSLKIFLTALAIIDDLGAVLIIALFYSQGLSVPYLMGAGIVLLLLFGLNRRPVLSLVPYLILGAILWWLVLKSGVHATLAGVMLAFFIPLRGGNGRVDNLAASPLHRLEHHMHKFVPLIVVPIFGFANAGVSFAGMGMETVMAPLTLGIAFGLFFGKLIGVFGSAALIIKLGWADMPVRAGWGQLLGISLLCGIGFTMSLFIGLLAFAGHPLLIAEAKIGILAGSLVAAICGLVILRFSKPDLEGKV